MRVAVARWTASRERRFGFGILLVGFVMKKSKGNADAKKVNQLLAARVKG